MITPALLIIPLVHFAGRKMEHPRVNGVLQTVVIASAGLLLAAAIPLARDALTEPITIAIAIAAVSLVVLRAADNRDRYALDHPSCCRGLALGLGGRRSFKSQLGGSIAQFD